jgi:hypothetical protein
MLAGAAALLALALLAPVYAIAGLLMGGEWLVKWLMRLNERRRDRIEVELDRKQEELRSTIWQLASELSADAHETRKAMIRASFEASQHERD